MRTYIIGIQKGMSKKERKKSAFPKINSRGGKKKVWSPEKHLFHMHKESSLNTFLHCSQFSSVAQLCLTLCDSMDCSTPGFPVHHQLPGLTQTHVHWAGDDIQPSHPLSSPSPPAFNVSQYQGLFQRVCSSNQVAKVLELKLQHQSFQGIFRTDFLKDWLV